MLAYCKQYIQIFPEPLLLCLKTSSSEAATLLNLSAAPSKANLSLKQLAPPFLVEPSQRELLLV